MRQTIAVAPFLFMLAAMAVGTWAILYNAYLIASMGLSYLIACPTR